ncbi:MAG TPA: 2-phospho-L-lactate guanylyltransferase [Acidimicrobiales bacterium]|nr:2-phospho-L-lactate guanylyltransferase [Acidimicrobiales bacterium]
MPVKAFDVAKLRLAPALAPGPRQELVRSMATSVIRAAGDLPVAVVCDDTSVARWATAQGARVVWAPGKGLDGAVGEGVRALADDGAERVIVAHADLPLAADLAWLARFPGVTLVPDHRDDGTNVACVPAGSRFPFSYGPRSFSRHAAAALGLGLALRVVREPLLGRDIDVPADLEWVGTVVAGRLDPVPG